MNKQLFLQLFEEIKYGSSRSAKGRQARAVALDWAKTLWNHSYQDVSYQVTRVDWVPRRGLLFSGKVTAGEKTVGRFRRSVWWVDGYGFQIEHDYFGVQKAWQGRVQGKRWVQLTLRRYRKHGIRKVSLVTGLAWGGYLWAKTGFNWEDKETAEDIACYLDELLKETDPDLQKNQDRFGPSLAMRQYALRGCTLRHDVQTLLEDGKNRKLVAAAASRLRQKKPMSAQQLALLGKRGTRGNVWLGKALLAGTGWEGRLNLR